MLSEFAANWIFWALSNGSCSVVFLLSTHLQLSYCICYFMSSEHECSVQVRQRVLQWWNGRPALLITRSVRVRRRPLHSVPKSYSTHQRMESRLARYCLVISQKCSCLVDSYFVSPQALRVLCLVDFCAGCWSVFQVFCFVRFWILQF